MQPFKIYPLRIDEVAKVKADVCDAYGNSAEASKAVTDRSICRRCLRRFTPGDERILFKYCPFKLESVFAETGPIFVHTQVCEPASEPLTHYPEELRSLPLLLRAYTAGDRQVIAELVEGGAAESIINRYFSDSDVAYLHLRDGEYGCYIARIERAESQVG